MIHWKFTAGCAAVAVILSIAAGLFGRVAAGPIIMRSILSGIVFGGIAVGFELLSRKFLPELFSNSENVDNNSGEEELGVGSEVDIVVDEDEPVSFTPDGEMEEVASVADDTVVEADDESGFIEEPAPLDTASGDETPGSESIKEPEPGGTAMSGIEEPVTDSSSENGLPNIEDFSGSFGSVPGGTANVDSLDSGKARTLEAIDSLGGENDPATMAKAIRSMVKKDQEG